MSFYRTLLAAVAAIAIASPVFADDAANASQTTPSDSAAPAAQTDNSAMQPAADQTSDATEAKINVNKASAKELMKVKGLRPAQARAIVAYRKHHGDFKSLDDLASVKGFKKIKTDKMDAIKAQLVTE